MTTITFKWSNVIHTGIITSQNPNTIMGQRTDIKITHMDNKPIVGFSFTIFGKCEVGYCGPFNVISIKSDKN